MMKYIWPIIILSVVGCSGAPKIETQYFLLTPATQQSSAEKNSAAEIDPHKLIILEPVFLAEYLDQPGIVLQTDQHQIEVAHYHRWAEPLKRNIHRFVLETLATQKTDYSFQPSTNFSRELTSLTLSLHINQFNGSAASAAILSGHWVLKQTKSNELVNTMPFSYEAPLEQDGYPELVAQLANLLETLCKDIAEAI